MLHLLAQRRAIQCGQDALRVIVVCRRIAGEKLLDQATLGGKGAFVRHESASSQLQDAFHGRG